jgi:hypothetical protein
MLSTLITGLDGRSNFERNGGALAPLLIDVPKLFIDLGTKAHFQLSSVSDPRL